MSVLNRWVKGGDIGMSARQTSILVVDDDVHILRMMQRILELEGYGVFTSSDGEAALDTFDMQAPDLVLLDLVMPDMDGYTVCQRIREFSQTPIIIVSVKNDDGEKVQGFDSGADGYITKPFSSKVLAAQIRAVLRRTDLCIQRPEPPFTYGDLMIDLARHRVTVAGYEVNLTATEHALLTYLARNAGRLLTSVQILEKVWGEDHTGETHLLQVNMARLRQKLGENAGNARYILTRPGIGYMMPQEA